MKRKTIITALLIFMLSMLCSCGGPEAESQTDGDDVDGDDATESDGDADTLDVSEESEDTENVDGDEVPVRFLIEPATMNGFGHETVTVTDSDCGLPTDYDAILVQNIEAVLIKDSDACAVTFDVQGGDAGDAVIAFQKGDETLLEVPGFSYDTPRGGGLFDKTWIIGDSLGAAMVSSYLSYESQVKDGMYAFFQRQAGAFCPHPLVRQKGFPGIIGLDAIDPNKGEIKTSALMPNDMLPYYMGEKPLSDLRLNLNTQARNLSIPGMHDVTWPFREVIYDPEASSIITKQLSLYERLLRFPGDIPEHPTPIMDQVEAGQPTFIHVSMGVLAYVLIEPVYVYDEDLTADLDAFLARLAEIESAPIVVLGTMPDSSSMPTRHFYYSERYENIRINNLMRAAVDRANSANSALSSPRFFIVPTGEFFLDMMTPRSEITLAGITYPVSLDDKGWPRIEITDSNGVMEPIGLGRFQGFFSLDHIHLTPTGHAIVANLIIEHVNASLGPDSDVQLMTENLPYIDIAQILSRDPMRESLLQAEAVELGLPDLSEFVDPLPPELTTGEHCAIEAGPHAWQDAMVCPAEIEVLVNGLECGETAIAWPAEISVKVLDDSGEEMEGVPVGLAVLPAESHGLAHWYASGLSDADGLYTATLEVPGEEQAGGILQFQAGSKKSTCLIP